MRTPLRIFFFLIFGAALYWMFQHTQALREQQAKEAQALVAGDDTVGGGAVVGDAPEPLGGGLKLLPWWLGIIALIIVTAVLFCVTFLPMLGEFVGRFFFSPQQTVERSPHADALARLAAGDVEGAIEEYKDCYAEDPSDTHAASEVVRLYCDKLHRPEDADAFVMEATTMGEHTPEQHAFLAQRMVDVCWDYQRDALRARAILIKIAEDMPETREAANALHRLQEIDRVMSQTPSA